MVVNARGNGNMSTNSLDETKSDDDSLKHSPSEDGISRWTENKSKTTSGKLNYIKLNYYT